MQITEARQTLTEAVEAVIQETDAWEEIEKRQEKARERRERDDVIWYELILSMGTWQGSEGNVIATDESYYRQLAYEPLTEMEESDRIDYINGVLEDAGVGMDNRKARYISQHVEKIRDLGGLDAAREEFESRDGTESKIEFLQQFNGIAQKYSRNIGMDIHHPEFRDVIAVDARIKSISDDLGLSFDDYQSEEDFYRSVAREAGLSTWELDRLLYNYTEEVTNRIP